MCHVTLSLFRFDSLIGKLWVFSQMGLAKPALKRMDGLRFFKLMGTGGGAGFSTKPNLSCYTLLCVWDSSEAADKALSETKIVKRYQAKADQSATLHMRPTQSRGQWSGAEPFKGDYPAQSNPVIALTRAALAPAKLLRFWERVPAISDAIEKETSMRFMMGMGEVPWLHQVTFSIWDDGDAMVRFSRNSATHGEAVKRAYQDGWFKENLFARFNLIRIDGVWDGLETIVNNAEDNDKLLDVA